MQPILRNVEDFSWVFIIIMSIGVFLVITKFLFNKSFQTLNNLQSFKELDSNTIPLAISVNIILGTLVGLFAYKFLKISYFIKQDVWISIIFLIIASCVIILFKFLINSIIFNFLNDKIEFKKIIRTKIFIRIYLIFILLILTLLLYYTNLSPYYTLLALIGLFLVVLLIEYYQQISNSKVNRYINSYYFILYLCVLEILPILYIYNHWYK